MSDASRPPVALAVSEKPKRSDHPHHARVVYRRSAPVDVHLAELAQLHVDDKKIEQRRKRLLTVAIISLIFGFVLFVVFIGILFLLLAGVLFLVRETYRTRDVDDGKLHAARYVLESLAPELKPGQKVTLALDFGSYDKTVPTSKNVSWGSGAKTFEKSGWLKMRFTLLDGSQMSLVASTKVKRKQTQKRKYLKLKDRVVEELEVELSPPKGRALEAVSAAKLEQRFAGPHALALKRCSVKPRLASFVFRTPAAVLVGSAGGIWRSTGAEHLLDGDRVLEAVITSYKAVASEAHARPAA